MMGIFDKEKQAVDLIMNHADKTGECVDAAADVLKQCIAGNTPQTRTDVRNVNDLEREADQLLRDIRELLYSGAYLPLIRGDIYRLMSAIDDVANKAEDCCDLCCLQKPQVDAEYRSQIIAIIDQTTDAYSELQKALENFFKPKGERSRLRAHTNRVSELESLIDTGARALTKQIFASSAPLAEKLHLQEFVSSVIRISDVAEDAADELDLVSVKSVI